MSMKAGKEGTCMLAQRCNPNYNELSINYTKCGYDYCAESLFADI